MKKLTAKQKRVKLEQEFAKMTYEELVDRFNPVIHSKDKNGYFYMFIMKKDGTFATISGRDTETKAAAEV